MAETKTAAGAKDKWEFYEDKKGEWRWRRKATNGNIVGSSCEGYKDKKDCEANAARHGWPEFKGEVKDSWAKDKWEFYEDKRGEWRWRRKASNGEIVGAATEGYNKKPDCEENAKRNGWNGK